MRRSSLAAVPAVGVAAALAGCPARGQAATVELVFGGDVMLGRGVARPAASDPNGAF